MLSEHVPIWLIGILSPVLGLLSARFDLAPRFKPILAFIFAVAATAGVVVFTPLGVEVLPDQAIIIYGLLITGFAAGKVMPTGFGGARGAGMILAPAMLLLFAGLAHAQVVEVAQKTGEVLKPVADTLVLLVAWGAGWLGRLIRKHLRF